MLERLLQHKADTALRVGHDQVERRGVYFRHRQFVAAQDETHLRPVAVGEHHVPAGKHHIGHIARGFAHRVPLVRHVRMTIVENERVAADRDDGGFCGRHREITSL